MPFFHILSAAALQAPPLYTKNYLGVNKPPPIHTGITLSINVDSFLCFMNLAIASLVNTSISQKIYTSLFKTFRSLATTSMKLKDNGEDIIFLRGFF